MIDGIQSRDQISPIVLSYHPDEPLVHLAHVPMGWDRKGAGLHIVKCARGDIAFLNERIADTVDVVAVVDIGQVQDVLQPLAAQGIHDHATVILGLSSHIFDE
jgi:hypothetical protein